MAARCRNGIPRNINPMPTQESALTHFFGFPLQLHGVEP
jgi:hypothetical protein